MANPVVPMLLRLEEMWAKDGWDQPPAVMLLSGSIDDVEVKEAFITPDMVHPREILEVVGNRVRELKKMGEDPLAVVVVTEGWAFPEGIERALHAVAKMAYEKRQLAQQGVTLEQFLRRVLRQLPFRPSDLKDRVETRSVTALMRDGTLWYLERRRDRDDVRCEDVTDGMTGTVVDAMRKALGVAS